MHIITTNLDKVSKIICDAQHSGYNTEPFGDYHMRMTNGKRSIEVVFHYNNVITLIRACRR